MPNANTMAEALEFDWNVFETQQQFLHWQQSSTDPLSPESMVSPTQTSHDLSTSQDHDSPRGSGSSTDGDATTASKKGQKSPDKRRCQNRKAQRAFRQRQKQHAEGLEQRLQSILSDYEELQQNYTRLQIDYNSLLQEREAKAGVETVAFTQGWSIEGSEMGNERDGVYEIDDFLLSDDAMKWNTM